MPSHPPPPPEHAQPEEVRRQAVEDARALIADGKSQRAACDAVAAPLGVSGRSILRWAESFDAMLPAGPSSAREANAVRSHLVMSMQRQRDLAQELLRVIDVRVKHVARQARRGAQHVDSTEVGRLVGDLGALQRIDERLMLQVGRLDPNGSAAEAAAAGAMKADDAVSEYASQWRRDREAFRPPEGPGPEVPPSEGTGSA